ncbi:hypothetical protein MUY21_07530 [Aliiroseovarius sp. S2029]|uniref:TadE/TadG family type IV pilus assembly protein n=1 Tax=Aliiroseovarius sp. S2029 TaxID=2936988 RepID=UPI0020C0D861|nr:hypothetical protein [Aliiroseovarius sp. S2029]MCK8483883.1 hypothetical protein [Aliiroseovarius sp. S2029]
MFSNLKTLLASGGRTVRRARAGLRKFARVEAASITVESVIILPILLFGLMATYTYFEAYRRQSLALKANYAIADYLSRLNSFDRTTLEGLDELFEYMSGTREGSWVRVTVVECNQSPARCNDLTPRRLGRGVSKTSLHSGVQNHTRTTMREYLGPYIPKMYKGEKLIVVETVAKYVPPFPVRWTGIYPRDLVNVTVTSPREYDGLCWKVQPEDCPLPSTS